LQDTFSEVAFVALLELLVLLVLLLLPVLLELLLLPVLLEPQSLAPPVVLDVAL
jgi:hypothetical protein